MDKQPLGPNAWRMIGQMRAHPLYFFMDIFHKYGDVAKIDFGFRKVYMLNHPRHVKHILQDNNKNYTKETLGFKNLKLALGEGLVTSDGSFWLRQRRIAQPAFHRKHIASFAQTMVKETEKMLQTWESYVDKQQPFDISIEMMHVTLQIVTKTLFQTDLSDTINHLQELEVLTTQLNQYINKRIYRLVNLPVIFPTPANIRFRRILAFLDREVYEMIKQHRNMDKEAGNLLSLLMNARDEETGAVMTDQQLRDEMFTLLAAGHETTANALTWTWYLLSTSPDVAQQFYTELDQVLGGRFPTFEDVEKLKYTKMVIQEAMRIYPPAWIMSRYAIASDEIDGYHIPAKSIVVVSPYITHRHPDFWENPEGFDPQRFAEEKKDRPRFAYFPFGGGPRRCIGDNFAMMEAILVLASIGSRYQLHLLGGHRVELEPLITLRPKYGMLMTLHKRQI